VVVGVILGTFAGWPAAAAAEPVSFPHGTIDQEFTVAQPGAATGSSFTGSYHAADDPNGDPPYMRRMTFYPPAGTRYDTTVPKRCRASDEELELGGPAACPEGSRLGGGTATGKFMGSVNTLPVDVFNNTGEVIMVISSPGVFTVSRGKLGADGTTEFSSPTCYPSVSVAGCPVDNALQLGSTVTMPAYVRDGRSYLTAPPECPASGYWDSTVRFWWADGTEDTVPMQQACAAP